MYDIRTPLEFSAVLTSLKPSVLSVSLILMEMIMDGKKEIEIDDSETQQIVALLMYDALVKDILKYSYLDDFDFTKVGKIIRLNDDKEKVCKNLSMMVEYMMYRIEAPVDLGNC
jgi:hypothetical protein